MVPVPSSAEEQSWAVFGTVMETCSWKERTPSPGRGCVLQGGVSFWQSLTLEGDGCLVSEADVSHKPPSQEPAGIQPRLSSTRGGSCSVDRG